MAQPLTDAINALTTYANSVTGKTPPDTTLSDAVATLAAGYGGGTMGGLANMLDVSSVDYAFAYMLMKMKKGETAGGTVTYTSAFTNTKTKILETGLTEIHGIMFIDPARNLGDSNNNGTCKILFLFKNSEGRYDAIAECGTNVTKVLSQEADVVLTSTPLNGGVSFSGGDFYYTGRYNQNGNYQILKVNTLYEWLAW